MSYREEVKSAKRAILYRYLSQTGGNMAKAAKAAGVHRTTFYKLLERHGIAVETRKYIRTDLPTPTT